MLYEQTLPNETPSRPTAFKLFSMLFIIAGAAVVMTVFGGFIELSSFAVGMAKYVLALSCAWTVDNFLLPEINTRLILKRYPKSYAIFLCINVLCATWCIASS